LQGPHQVAEKSTSTVFPEWMTSLNLVILRILFPVAFAKVDCGLRIVNGLSIEKKELPGQGSSFQCEEDLPIANCLLPIGT
jgi:hypothetical protein